MFSEGFHKCYYKPAILRHRRKVFDKMQQYMYIGTKPELSKFYILDRICEHRGHGNDATHIIIFLGIGHTSVKHFFISRLVIKRTVHFQSSLIFSTYTFLQHVHETKAPTIRRLFHTRTHGTMLRVSATQLCIVST